MACNSGSNRCGSIIYPDYVAHSCCNPCCQYPAGSAVGSPTGCGCYNTTCGCCNPVCGCGSGSGSSGSGSSNCSCTCDNYGCICTCD